MRGVITASEASTTRKRLQALRWTARIIGSLALAFFAFGAIVGSQAMDSSDQARTLFGLVGLAILGYSIAWFREGVGGAIVVASGVGLAGLAVKFPALGSPLMIGIPLFVIGALFLGCWWMARRQET